MLKQMNKNPIVFAMANPDPEIPYADALGTRDDVKWQPVDQIILIK